MLINPRLFPAIMIALNICAATVYAANGDWRRTVYWIAAAVLTITVTW